MPARAATTWLVQFVDASGVLVSRVFQTEEAAVLFIGRVRGDPNWRVGQALHRGGKWFEPWLRLALKRLYRDHALAAERILAPLQ